MVSTYNCGSGIIGKSYSYELDKAHNKVDNIDNMLFTVVIYTCALFMRNCCAHE